MEQICLQPVAIATALVLGATVPLHFFAMINLFSKMNAHFQKEILKNRNGRRVRLPAPALNPEESQAFV